MNANFIGLMKHIIKLLINKIRNRIKPKMGQEGFSFVQDSGTRDTIFMIRITPEQPIQM